mmetsp:Transcript_52740/g.59681  ORF Transcript_52740/g.59681 Transcript_52740/m.59681 type:complete len:96 (+) Transcript_52740:198-485(+)
MVGYGSRRRPHSGNPSIDPHQKKKRSPEGTLHFTKKPPRLPSTPTGDDAYSHRQIPISCANSEKVLPFSPLVSSSDTNGAQERPSIRAINTFTSS